MEGGLQEKLISGVIRGVTAAATGTGLAQVFTTTWIGRRAYDSFRESLDVLYLPHPPLPDAVFEELTYRVLLPPEIELEASLLLLAALPLLAVLGHVVYRGNLEEESGGRLRRLYRRCHFGVTLLLSLALAGLVAAAPTAGMLLVSWALLALAAGLYLVLYGSDLRQRRFTPRFVWIALALVFFANLVILPQVHGQRFFDLDLVQVKVEGDDASPYRYALATRHDVLFDLDYSGGRVSVKVELGDGDTGWRPLDKQEITLRRLLLLTEAPALVDQAVVDRQVNEVLAQAIGGSS